MNDRLGVRASAHRSDSPVVILGEFDGFHLGHRQLVHAGVSVARRSSQPAVGIVLADRSADEMITSVDERCWALLASGASSALVISLTSADDPAVGRDVVDQIVDRIHPSAVVMACLPDDVSTARFPALRAEFSRRGVEVVEVPRFRNPDGRFITSAAVRSALASAEIAHANDLLGRSFTLAGTVVHGSGLGHTIGFPTANLDLPGDLLIPKRGVYAAFVELDDGEHHRAAVNIGVRPTVENDGKVLVEAHLLDFDGDLYGTTIQVAFRRWLRAEQRFASVDQLVDQLALDVDHARLVLRT